MESAVFSRFRTAVLCYLDKFGVRYTVVNDSTVQLIQSACVADDKEKLNILFLALEQCGFDIPDILIERLFTECEQTELGSDVFRLFLVKDTWKAFYIELCFRDSVDTAEESFTRSGFTICAPTYRGRNDKKGKLGGLQTSGI